MRVLSSHNVLSKSSLMVEFRLNGHRLVADETLLIDDWQATQASHLETHLVMDLDQALKSLGLGSEAQLGLLISAFSGTTNYKATSRLIPITSDSTNATLDVEPNLLGGTIAIETLILVIKPGADVAEFAPEKYDLVAKYSAAAQVEGDYGRASVELLDFRQIFGEQYAMARWHFALTPPAEVADWKFADINSVIRVYVNEPRYKILSSGEISLFKELIRADYVRNLILLVVDNTELLEYLVTGSDEESGSLYTTVANLLKIIFADRNAIDIQNTWKLKRSLIEAEIHSYVADYES